MSRVSGVALRLEGVDAAPAPGAAAVLRGLTLALAPGEQVAVIGASGAGKTTLLHTLALAVAPKTGGLWLDGQAPWELSTAGRQRLRPRVFLAPQQPPLPPRQRVVASVLAGRLPQQSFWASLRTLWSPSLAEAELAQQALAAVDLPDKLWLRVDRLSGGERQRVGLARALVSAAGLWLMDEPLAALDPRSAGRVIDLLTTRARTEGRTLVCSLHQVDLARERFARVLALRAGRLVYDGPADGLDDEHLRRLYGGVCGGEPAATPSLDMPPERRPGADTATALPGTMCR